MPRELRALVRARHLVRSVLEGLPSWQGPGLVAAVVGVGPAAARTGTERVLDMVRPERVLVIGVAGAVGHGLAVGDVVAPHAVVDAASGARFVPHPLWAGAPDGGHRRGELATVARLGASVPPGATVVDMETAAIAAACEAAGVPWDVRRAVSDLPGTLEALPSPLVRPDGRTDLAAVAHLLARHPGALRAMLRLGRDAGSAVGAVTRAVLEELAAAERSGAPGAVGHRDHAAAADPRTEPPPEGRALEH